MYGQLAMNPVTKNMHFKKTVALVRGGIDRLIQVSALQISERTFKIVGEVLMNAVWSTVGTACCAYLYKVWRTYAIRPIPINERVEIDSFICSVCKVRNR